MKKLGVWLIVFLAALSVAGVVVALLLDYLMPEWMSAHPLTSGVLSGIIGLPLTTLIAVFLVDYFVERAESSRREPLITFLKAAVIDDALNVLRYIAPHRSMPGDQLESIMSGMRHSVVGSYEFDILNQISEDERSVKLPEGWVPFPLSEWEEGHGGASEMNPKRHVVEALARTTGSLKSHLQQLSEAQGDVGLLHFMHIFQAECLQWVDFYIEKARDPEGFRSKENQTLDIYRRWAGAELLGGLLIHLGKVEISETYRRDWVKAPRVLDDFWVHMHQTNAGYRQ